MTKFSSLLAVLLLMLVSFTANSQDYPRGDVSQDGNVSISDVTCLIDYLLSGLWPGEHAWVDLGLPSGTLWATCNVGASRPEDYGDYFAWGENEPKDYYDWSTYKWCNGSDDTMTKYCINSSYSYNGFIDGKTELDSEDDAAFVNWGEQWRMPTYDQLNELKTKCSWTWTTRNSVNGQLATGPNGNSIFFPAAGSRWLDFLLDTSSFGYYWSRTLSTSSSGNSYHLSFFSGGHVGLGYSYSRGRGMTVRAVRVSEE